MKIDDYGNIHYTELDLFKALYNNPELDIGKFNVVDPEKFNKSADDSYSKGPRLKSIPKPEISVEEFDKANQSEWNMPDEYKNLDIIQWILDQCKTQDELQRCGHEILKFQERGLVDLLKFLKYFVDVMNDNNVVMGLGRGSSVASYVLFKIGIHRVDSMYYDLDIDEFLR